MAQARDVPSSGSPVPTDRSCRRCALAGPSPVTPRPFADLFNKPTWANALLLLTGALLAPGRRTGAAALHILGREQEADYATYHRVLARVCWSSREVAGAFAPPAGRGLRGARSRDRPLFRRHDRAPLGAEDQGLGDRVPVRSSKGHFVKASGLRWLAAMLISTVSWAGLLRALLTALVPSERFYGDGPHATKALLDAAR